MAGAAQVVGDERAVDEAEHAAEREHDVDRAGGEHQARSGVGDRRRRWPEVKQRIGSWGLRLTRWQTDGRPPDARRYVAIAAPHTSNFELSNSTMLPTTRTTAS